MASKPVTVTSDMADAVSDTAQNVKERVADAATTARQKISDTARQATDKDKVVVHDERPSGIRRG